MLKHYAGSDPQGTHHRAERLGYYDNSVRDSVNPYALYKRAPDGDTEPTVPRLIVEQFKRLAAG